MKNFVIFVEQRIATHILQYVIESHPLSKERFRGRSEVVYSASSPASPHHSLTKKGIDMALGKFKSGQSNLMISTTVMEEGLDVQKANCVIRFDSMVNSISLTQSRGRARQTNSSFIVMKERSDRSTRDLEIAEQIQMEMCRNFHVIKKTPEEKEKTLQNERMKQQSRESNAWKLLHSKTSLQSVTIDETNSLQLLNLFCKQTKVDLIEASGNGTFMLTYSSILRKHNSSAALLGKGGKKARKIAKRCAAVQMLDQLQHAFQGGLSGGGGAGSGETKN